MNKQYGLQATEGKVQISNYFIEGALVTDSMSIAMSLTDKCYEMQMALFFIGLMKAEMHRRRRSPCGCANSCFPI